MIEQGEGGRIITFSSRGGFFGPTPAYAAAQGSGDGDDLALSADLSARGITANCILPSATTQLFPGDDPTVRTFGGVAVAQSLDPNDVAPVVVYLATPAAASITGRYLYAAGGWYLRVPAADQRRRRWKYIPAQTQRSLDGGGDR